MERITKVLVWQFVVTIAISSILYVGFGAAHAQAALFGGATASVLSILLKVMVESINTQLIDKKKVNKTVLALLFIPRLILVAALFACGIGLLHLNPIPMVASFAAAYSVYWMDWKFSREEHSGAV